LHCANRGGYRARAKTRREGFKNAAFKAGAGIFRLENRRARERHRRGDILRARPGFSNRFDFRIFVPDIGARTALA